MNALKNLEQENRGEPIRDSVGRVLARKASGIHNDQGCQVHLLQATLGLFFFEAANKHWQLRVAVFLDVFRWCLLLWLCSHVSFLFCLFCLIKQKGPSCSACRINLQATFLRPSPSPIHNKHTDDISNQNTAIYKGFF